MPTLLALVAAVDSFESEREWDTVPAFEPLGSDGPRTARILIVDDEAAVRHMLARLLTEEGHQVVEAEDGLTALRVSLEEPEGFDLVITDVKMPVIDGWELGRRINAMVPGLPILYVSAYTPDAASEFARRGSAPFIRKPFDPDDLLRVVSAILRDPPI